MPPAVCAEDMRGSEREKGSRKRMLLPLRGERASARAQRRFADAARWRATQTMTAPLLLFIHITIPADAAAAAVAATIMQARALSAYHARRFDYDAITLSALRESLLQKRYCRVAAPLARAH